MLSISLAGHGQLVKMLITLELHMIFFIIFGLVILFWSAVAQCRVLDSRPEGCGFEPHRCHCVLSLSKTH